MKRGTKAFTLIELLVVIGILAVLAALLFPVFTTAKRQAKGVDCVANLRQIGTAMQMYVSHYDGAYPNGGDAISTLYNYSPLYVDQLAPYVTEKEVFHCPLDSGVVMANEFWTRFPPINSTPSSFEKFGFSYNYVFASRERTYTVREQQVLYPSKTRSFYDQSGAWHPGQEKLRPNLGFLEDDAIRSKFRYTSLFFDGHVKNLSHREWQDSFVISLFSQ